MGRYFVSNFEKHYFLWTIILSFIHSIYHDYTMGSWERALTMDTDRCFGQTSFMCSRIKYITFIWKDYHFLSVLWGCQSLINSCLIKQMSFCFLFMLNVTFVWTCILSFNLPWLRWDLGKMRPIGALFKPPSFCGKQLIEFTS